MRHTTLCQTVNCNWCLSLFYSFVCIMWG